MTCRAIWGYQSYGPEARGLPRNGVLLKEHAPGSVLVSECTLGGSLLKATLSSTVSPRKRVKSNTHCHLLTPWNVQRHEKNRAHLNVGKSHKHSAGWRRPDCGVRDFAYKLREQLRHILTKVTTVGISVVKVDWKRIWENFLGWWETTSLSRGSHLAITSLRGTLRFFTYKLYFNSFNRRWWLSSGIPQWAEP